MKFKFIARPTFRQALMVNQLPIWVLTVLAVVFSGVVMGEVDTRADTITRTVVEGKLTQEEILQIADQIRFAWLTSFTFFLVFAAGTSLLAIWVYGHVSKRVETIVHFASRRAAGEPVEPLIPMGSDPLGKLERAIIDVSDRVQQRDEALRQETERSRFDARLQRAFELAEREPQALDAAEHALSTLFGDHEVDVLLSDDSGAHLRRHGGESEREPRCSVEAPMDCAAIRRGVTLRFESSNAIDACPILRKSGRGPCSAICAPLNVMGASVGVLHLEGLDGQLPASGKLAQLEGITTHAGTRLAVLRTLMTSQVQARTDPLTGLLNRRSFEASAERRFSSRTEGTHAVVMCDLDHFKRLNDTAGHAAGDRALKLFAQTLKQNLRPRDIVGRHGGEEFILLLDGCTASGARSILNRFREKLQVVTSRYNGPPFTSSFGVSIYPADGIELLDLTRSADGALYQAKEAGRDCVVTTMDSLPEPEPETSRPADDEPAASVPALRRVEA